MTRLVREVRQIRIGLVAHGDYIDWKEENVIKICDFTTDVELLQSFVKDAPKTMGGGDGGEVITYSGFVVGFAVDMHEEAII